MYRYSDFHDRERLPTREEIVETLEKVQALLIDQRLSPEEIEIRKEILSEQLMRGGDLTLRGINIADIVIRTEQFGF